MLEQVLVRGLPTGFKARLRALAESHGSDLEAEARKILVEALERQPVTIVDLLAADDDIDFTPGRLS